MTTFFHDIRYALRVLGQEPYYPRADNPDVLRTRHRHQHCLLQPARHCLQTVASRDPETVVDVTVRRPVSFSEYNYLRERNSTEIWWPASHSNSGSTAVPTNCSR